MLLERILVHNFKGFEGTQVLNVSVSQNSVKNIILIGGLNGAGKTTILEAVKLCLYGRENKDLWSSSDSYSNFILTRLNYASRRNIAKQTMRVQLDFTGVNIKGLDHEMAIGREWTVDCEQNELCGLDKPEIILDSKPFELIEEDYWQDFIRDFIPIGVSKFFFFDGEKIQTIAEEIDHKELEVSIRDVLGLNVFETLNQDLKHHSDRLRKEADKVTSTKLMELNLEKAKAESEIASKTDLIDSTRFEIDELHSANLDLDREIKRVAGVNLSNLEDAKNQFTQAESDYDQITNEIVELCGELLPFAISGKLCEQLKTRLAAEAKLIEWQTSKNSFQPKIQEIIEGLVGNEAPSPLPPLNESQRKFLRRRIEQVLEGIFEPKPSNAAESILHDNSQREREQVTSILDSIQTTLANQLRVLSKQREQKQFIRDKLQKELLKAPEDSRSKEFIEKRERNLIQIGGKDKEIEQNGFDIEKLQREIQGLLRQIASVEESLVTSTRHKNKVELCKRIQSAILDYSTALKTKRIEELEKHITDMYKRLSRKGELVANVDIDPVSFDVNLHNINGDIVNKRNMSAGEKQIYAISLLWGLAKGSNNQLPIIIDTPFGRLDSVHRHNIVTNYFPHASKQVIILSTDTEIKGENYELIAPYIERSFHLEFDKEYQRTNVTEGYFPE